MKFLKTFLFTISLTFLSFGIVSLKGFCTSVALDPSLSPAVNSNINQFSSFAITPEYMSIYGPAYIDELNTQLYQNYGWDLETLSWYGEDRFKGYMFGQETNPINSTDLTPQIANAISNRMLSGTIETIVTAKSLYDNGYNFFCNTVPQWGTNAKQWILGKVDSVSGKITEVGSNVVTKITADGLSNYTSIYNSMINNGSVSDITSVVPLYGKNFNLNINSSATGDYYFVNINIQPSTDVLFYLSSPSGYLRMCIPTDSPDITSVTSSSIEGVFDGYGINRRGEKISSVGFRTYSNLNTITVNNKTYYICVMSFGDTHYSSYSVCESPSVGVLSNNTAVSDYLSSHEPSIAFSYDYSSSWQSALQGQLDRLIGKYVDSISLKRIQDILDSIPIGVENVGGVDVPVAIPNQSIVDELTSAVDDAVALDPDYEAVFEDADAVVLDPDIPLPTPNNQGTEVPEDFPNTIFTPINDSVGSMFDFVSIFEPLFYIFSFSTGLLGLWIVVPFVILFLILFRLLK